MDDVLMERGFLSAPWQVMMRSFRTGHKGVIKEAEAVSGAVQDALDEAVRGACGAPPALPPHRVDALIARVLALQRRVERARAADRRALATLRARIAHLEARAPRAPPPGANGAASARAGSKRAAATGAGEGGGGGETGAAAPPAAAQGAWVGARARTLRWEKARLDRVLVDYMLREGMYLSAERLAASERIEPLVDAHVFREARRVISALRRRDCSEALRWCAEHKRRLGKTQSTLEFRLHLQEYVEFVRAGQKMLAIPYAQKWLSAGSKMSQERQEEIGRFMSLLAFPASTPCQPYKDMYSPKKWKDLEETFKQENYKLHGLTNESTLEILLKTGLASLKTRKCGVGNHINSNCPTCNEPYLSLAEYLPTGQRTNSILVCAISGEIMDENNPPMALPNGNVYSFNALQELSAQNEGAVIDPKTQKNFSFDQLKKCYIM